MKHFRAGQYIQQGYYKAFQPTALCRTWAIDDLEMIKLLSEADRHLGRLDMFSEYVNVNLFIQTHLAKEATQSTRIEGTQTSMEDAFIPEEDVAPEHRADWQEVQNYIRALQAAISQLDQLPFSNRLIRNTHRTLMQGVRGEHKMPGYFRTSQNWIGGATLRDAVFVPPPHTAVPELMGDLEKFVHEEEGLPDLIKIALIHYQFETIHPFLDGNGRMGRLMIPLYLVSKGLLKRPILYLSDFFERHRALYFDNLMRVRTHHDLLQWCKFFLVGVIETAKRGASTFDATLQLDRTLASDLGALGHRAADARKVVNRLFERPVADAKSIANVIQKSPVSAYRLIAELESIGVLQEMTGGQRGKVYVFRKYLDLFKTD